MVRNLHNYLRSLHLSTVKAGSVIIGLGLLATFTGCGGGSGSGGLQEYTIQFTFMNTSSATVSFVGRDFQAQVETHAQTVPAFGSAPATDKLTSPLVQSSTSLTGRVFDINGTLVDTVSLNGVSVAGGKTTFVDLKWDGATLFIHAHHPPGNAN